MKVLLVDDEKEFVSAMAERLSFRGIIAEFVYSADEALKKIEMQCFDVGVLDVKMPGMNGIELQHQIVRKCPEMKFIFLTGHGSLEDFKQGAMEAGKEFYLPKPVQIDTLIEKMHQVLAVT